MYKNRRKRSLVIGGLLAILVCMTIGYAAFSTQLNISGTSSITSNWDVQITNITQGTPTGTGENAVAPSYTVTTATMEANLYSPGDAMTYEITIQNKGTIDAVLSKITKSDSNNPAILFETSGVNEGDTLLAGETAKMTVKISYNSSVTSQPENLSAEMAVTLEYTQAPEGYVPPVTGPSIGGQPVELVESGDGLYEDTYESGRYVYKGANPDNYIEFDNGEVWRIIAKEADGTYKLLKNELLPKQAWDTSNSNNWARPATLNTYLNGEYYTNLDSSIKDNIVSHTWGIGEVESNNDLSAQIVSEQGTTWSGNIGLISHSDYLRANSDMANCGTDKTNFENYETCRNTDWMYISGSYWWTISPGADYSYDVWSVYVNVFVGGDLSTRSANISGNAPRPAAYLKSDITLSGSGTLEDPYTIT